MSWSVLGAASSGAQAFRVVVIVVAVALAVTIRVVRRRRAASRGGPRQVARPRRAGRLLGRSQIGLVAQREVRERLRSRVLRVGTLVILAVVAAGVVIPVLTSGGHSHQRVGVVGALSPPLRATIAADGAALGSEVSLVDEPSLPAAEADLRAKRLALVVVDARRILVTAPLAPTDTSATALLARAVASQVSLQTGLQQAGLTPQQAARLAHPTPLAITSLLPSRANQTARVTALYGLILIFVLLSQYGTWILMGVVEEKASRVVEVLLAAMRPVQLLAGKVIGIGLVALGQATLVVAVALGLAKAVGSDLIKGTAPVEVLGVLVWLVLGYTFYSWVYAAGGSLAERQEHLQSLAFPLQLPILFGYLVSLTSLGASQPSTFMKVLAYLPPTAPFAMPVLVADGAVVWWQFLASVAVSLVATVGIAQLAAAVYRRAILRTGSRVRLRELVGTRA